MRLLLLGCTGFVGRELVPELISAGHHLTLVSRNTKQNFVETRSSAKLTYLKLNPATKESWQEGALMTALSKADGVINLAGEPIAEKRWSPEQREMLLHSRLHTTESLIDAMCRLRRPPRVLINASAVGYYGTSPSQIFTEEDQCGEDFLANLCKEWESAASKKPRSTRLIIFRIGIVLGHDGGALSKMLPIFKTGLGGPIGDGQQWMSWIHRTDLCRMIQESLTNKSWVGVVNAVAPNAVSMGKFAAELGKSLERPSLLPVPGPILKLLLGDGAKVVLEGQKVESSKLKKIGFQFKYPKLKQAFSTIIHSGIKK